jgi:hypothetical protein
MVIAFMVAAEIAFWALLLAGLAFRYPLRRPRAGIALLVATPFVDLALLARRHPVTGSARRPSPVNPKAHRT